MLALTTFRPAAVQIARLERSDGEALRRLFFRLSPQTIYRRFLSPIARPDQARPERLLDVDHHDREALVGLAQGEIVGVARYFRQPDTNVAELAVVVADAWQRQGIATALLDALAEIAIAAGVDAFSLVTQVDNGPMLGLLRNLTSARLMMSDGLYEGTVPCRDFLRGAGSDGLAQSSRSA